MGREEEDDIAFPDSFLQELADRNEIADVVSAYVPLTKRSGQNMFGLCPFHSEKTPSFSVSPSRQIYHCFGCGKGGSVINFVMEIENLSFPEAVEFLARRAGMQIPEQERDPLRPKRERLYAQNREAAMFFHEQLRAPGGAAAREYMERRGISPVTAKNFGLGFAPDSWDALVNTLKAKGYSEKEMFDGGLVRQGKKGGVYDTFRDRLMFPIIDVRGNVIAFSGRALGEGEPKYMNSPETPVFSKSHNLFALNMAKKSKSGYIILAEGNIDVVALHQAGFDSAVASLGTSLTPEQARLLSRYTNEIVIAYDADGAGQRAADRAIGLLEKLEMKVRVLRLTGAKDPDEFIRLKGADAFRNLLDGSENHVDFRLRSIKDKYDIAVDEQKVAFIKEAVGLIASLPGSVEREVYAMRVAAMCELSVDAITAEVKRQRKRFAEKAKRQQTREDLRPARAAQPKSRGIKYDNLRSAAAEEGVIRVLFLDPGLSRELEELVESDFSSPALFKMFSSIMKRAQSGASINIAAMSGELSQDEAGLLADILQKPEVLSNGTKALHDYIEIMRAENSRPGQSDEDILSFWEALKEKKGMEDKNG